MIIAACVVAYLACSFLSFFLCGSSGASYDDSELLCVTGPVGLAFVVAIKLHEAGLRRRERKVTRAKEGT